jgi:hypothetical protein
MRIIEVKARIIELNMRIIELNMRILFPANGQKTRKMSQNDIKCKKRAGNQLQRLKYKCQLTN